MTAGTEIFTALERQVIALAAEAAPRECGAIGEGGAARLVRGLLSRLVDGPSARPLANPRLEAIRRLACASFAAGGTPSRRALDAAREAGLAPTEIAAIAELAEQFPSRARAA